MEIRLRLRHILGIAVTLLLWGWWIARSVMTTIGQ
jgi:hypothetical protein